MFPKLLLVHPLKLSTEEIVKKVLFFALGFGIQLSQAPALSLLLNLSLSLLTPWRQVSDSLWEVTTQLLLSHLLGS